MTTLEKNSCTDSISNGDLELILSAISLFLVGGDYWLIKTDGTVVQDGRAGYYKEVYDQDSTTPREIQIEESEAFAMTKNGQALAISSLFSDMVQQKIGKNWRSIGAYSQANISSVLGVTSGVIPASSIAMITFDSLSQEQQKLLIGQEILTRSGYTFDSTSGQWTGGNLKFSNLNQGESMGITFKDGVGFEKFSVSMYATRDPKGFNVWKNGVTSNNVDDAKNTLVYFVKRDLATGRTMKYNSGIPWTSVDKANGDNVYNDDLVIQNGVGGSEKYWSPFPNINTYQGNTIASEQLKMHLKEATASNTELYGVDTVGVINDAFSLDNRYVRSDGRFADNGGRVLLHPFTQRAWSDACWGPVGQQGTWNDLTNVNGAKYNFNRDINMLRDWGVYNGMQMNVFLNGANRP